MSDHPARVVQPGKGLPPRRVWPAVLVLGAALGWSFAGTLVGLIDDWGSDDNYSVGALVPIVTLFLLWAQRERFAGVCTRVCWWGAGLVLAGQALRLFGVLLLFESAERYALWLTVVGLVLWLAGPAAMWKARWVLLFLLLAIPLPGRVHNAISGPLQSVATQGAVVGLEILGVTVLRQGNVVLLNDEVPVAVAEACSGLRLLTAFAVVTAAMAFLARRPAWQKAVVLVSCLPIAIACNVLRLTVTALLFLVVDEEKAEWFFHDCAGFFMMPLAVGAVFLEFWVLSRLVRAGPDTGN